MRDSLPTRRNMARLSVSAVGDLPNPAADPIRRVDDLTHRLDERCLVCSFLTDNCNGQPMGQFGGEAKSRIMEGMELLEGMATTRAIRRFRPDPIPTNDLAQILWHATRAPTGSNRQGFRFVVLCDGSRAREAKAILGDAFRAGWSTKRRSDGYASGSGREQLSPKVRTAAAMDRFVDNFEQIPVVVLPCLVRHRAADPTEGASIYPACQNLLLAARALGYGGVMTMWHLTVEAELRTILGIPGGVSLAACIPLGVPEGNHGPVRRRPVGELVFDDSWGAPASWAVDPEGTAFTAAGPPRSP